jgi:hypothetical protein
MPANTSLEFLLNIVQDKHKRLVSQIWHLVATLTENDQEKKGQAAKAAITQLTQLRSTISPEDYPAWISQLGSALTVYDKNYMNSGAGNDLMKKLIKLAPLVQNHQWRFEDSTGAAPIPFDSIYHEVYDASKTVDLFQSLLETLQEMIDSRLIDSVSAIKELERLISTIKANMRGSYISAVGTKDFTIALFKNILWETLSTVPALGVLLRAASTTIEELDIEMSEFHIALKNKLSEVAHTDVPLLRHEKQDIPQLPKITDDDTKQADGTDA